MLNFVSILPPFIVHAKDRSFKTANFTVDPNDTLSDEVQTHWDSV